MPKKGAEGRITFAVLFTWVGLSGTPGCQHTQFFTHPLGLLFLTESDEVGGKVDKTNWEG